jgi:hypothetical protein
MTLLGWKESTECDTIAFNLQTPSIFIDLRFPVHQKEKHSTIYNNNNNKNSLQDLTIEELKLLSQQHCFAGYSFPESIELQNSFEQANGVIDTNKYLYKIFTRHHVIDWNYNFLYPRSRPNKWFVEKDDKNNESFKEYSVVRTTFGAPLYMEVIKYFVYLFSFLIKIINK